MEGQLTERNLSPKDVDAKIVEIFHMGGVVGKASAWRTLLQRTKGGGWIFMVPPDVAAKIVDGEFPPDSFVAVGEGARGTDGVAIH